MCNFFEFKLYEKKNEKKKQIDEKQKLFGKLILKRLFSMEILLMQITFLVEIFKFSFYTNFICNNYFEKCFSRV